MKHKIRPFAKTWETFEGTAPRPLHVSGVIRDSHVRITIGKAEFTLPARDGGTDRFGDYAYIEDQTLELGLGWTLTVEPGDEDPGCRIALQGDASVDIYFNDAGECDGGGTHSPPSKAEHELH